MSFLSFLGGRGRRVAAQAQLQRAASVAVEALEQRAYLSITTFYDTDFEPNSELPGADNGATAVWSSTKKSVAPVAQTTFLGDFGKQTVSLNLSNLAAHDELTISFDLYLLRTWDGNYTGSGFGPDFWGFKVDGATLLNSTFSNKFKPEFPNTLNQNQGFGGQDSPNGNFAAGTGAIAKRTLGYNVGANESMDAVYRFTYTIAHTASTAMLSFVGAPNQSLGDESWGLDNITVTGNRIVPQVSAVVMDEDADEQDQLNTATLRLQAEGLGSEESVTVYFELSGAASADVDYLTSQLPITHVSGNLYSTTISGGSEYTDLTFVAEYDSDPEGDEDITITIVDDPNASIDGPSYTVKEDFESASAVIMDGFVSVSIKADKNTRVAPEGPSSSTVRVTLTRSGMPLDQPLDVTVKITGTSDNPATVRGEGADISAPHGSEIAEDGTLVVRIEAGKRDRVLDLTIVNDGKAEGLEEMTIEVLTNPAKNMNKVKRWIAENQYITIWDAQKNNWFGAQADAFSEKVIAAVKSFANQFEYKLSKPNAEAGLKSNTIFMDVPEGAVAAYQPDAAVEQQRVQLVNDLREGLIGPHPGGQELFTNFAIDRFKAIQGNRGRVYSHEMISAIFSMQEVTVRPGNTAITDAGLRNVAWNPDENIEGGGGAMNLAHEFVHIFADIPGGQDNERKVTNGENQVRWEVGINPRKQRGDWWVGGFSALGKLITVEPIKKAQ
jgi:hypothetical protein